MSEQTISKIQWVAVESSNIQRVSYDPHGNELYVQFVKDGRVYRYLNVEPLKYQALIESGSVGKYFYDNIRGQAQYLSHEVTSLFYPEEG